MTFTNMADVYKKLHRSFGEEVEYSEFSGTITLPSRNVTAFAEAYTLMVNITNDGQLFSQSIANLTELYSFLYGILKGRITIRRVDGRAVRVTGWDKESAADVAVTVAGRLLYLLLGIPLLIIGAVELFVFAFERLSFDEKPSMSMMVLPIFIGITVLGAASIHHAIVKKPVTGFKACSFGIGVSACMFAAMMMIALADGGLDPLEKGEALKLGLVFGAIMFAGIALIIFCFIKPKDKNLNVMPQSYMLVRVPSLPSKEDTRRLLAAVRSRAGTEALSIKLLPGIAPSIFTSKIGGLPYWDPLMTYPEANGQKLVLLAQFDLGTARSTGILPKQGMLQFFVSRDILGGRNDVRVVYHKEINRNISANDIRNIGVPDPAELRDFPVKYEYPVQLISTRVKGGCDEGELLHETARDLGIKIDSSLKYFEIEDPDGDKKEAPLSGTENYLLGTPHFINSEPWRQADHERFALLLQLGSSKAPFDMNFGNGGCCYFVIGRRDLEALNFDNVYFNRETRN